MVTTGMVGDAQRQGLVLVLTTVSLVTLLLFACLAVDVGYICALTTEQQNNADPARWPAPPGFRMMTGGPRTVAL